MEYWSGIVDQYFLTYFFFTFGIGPSVAAKRINRQLVLMHTHDFCAVARTPACQPVGGGVCWGWVCGGVWVLVWVNVL